MRQSKTQWKTGQSGNPKGRPTGTGQVATLRASISAALPDVIDALVTRAKEGDVAAARLLLKRTIPPLRPSISSLDGGVTAEAVALAVADGQLSARDAAVLLELPKALGNVRRAEKLEAKYAERVPSIGESIADLMGEIP